MIRPHARRRAGRRERLGSEHVALGEPRTRPERVDQVVGRVHALERRRQRGGIERVAGDGREARVIGEHAAGEARGRTSQAAHLVTVVEECRNQPATDVAGGAGDEDALV